MGATAEDLALFGGDEDKPKKGPAAPGPATADDLALFSEPAAPVPAQEPTLAQKVANKFRLSRGYTAEPTPQGPVARADFDAMTPQQRQHFMAESNNPMANDSIAQGIASGAFAAAAGGAAAPVLGRVLPAWATRLGVGAIEGGTANKSMGGDFTTGAVLGAIPGAAQGLGQGARAFGEGAIARSEARPPGTFKAAAKETAIRAGEVGTAAAADALLGHGHALTGLTAAARLAAPAARTAGIAADETAAAIARKLLARRTGQVAAETAETLSPVAREQIAAYQQAMTGATSEERATYETAIEDIRRRAATPRPAPPPMSVAPTVEIPAEVPATPSARVAAIQEARAGRRPIETAGRRELGAERRPIETSGYDPALTSAAESAPSQRDFIQLAVKKGLDARDARKIWRATHPYTPSAD